MSVDGSVSCQGNMTDGCQSEVNGVDVEFVEPDLQIAIQEQCLASTIIDQRQIGQDVDQVDQMLPACKEKEVTREEAEKALAKYFKNPGENSSFKKFDFKKFAEVNGITVDESCIPHSDSLDNNFNCMHSVATTLLSKGVTFKKKNGENIPIKLTPDEVLGIINTLGNIPDEDKAYKLYGKLGDVILGKLNEFVQDQYFDHDTYQLLEYMYANESLYRAVLSMPLTNVKIGVDLCARILHLALSHDNATSKSKESFSIAKFDEEFLCANNNISNYVNEFKKLGIFFAFRTEKLAEQLLPAAKFLTTIGMKVPLFIAEFSNESDIKKGVSDHDDDIDHDDILGKSYNHSGIIINTNVALSTNTLSHGCYFLNCKSSHLVLYHECTHHARSFVGVMRADDSLDDRCLEDIFKDNQVIINAINSQISEYALTEYEEYIAEFSSRVLYCLEQSENPFNYIVDECLWRLYYEFGGPDFMPIIDQKFYGDKGVILAQSGLGWCSGYPSKFGIDINQIKDQQVEVEGMTAIGQKSLVKIDETTILPPPPLGYCYTTENGKLQLKIDKTVLPNSTDNTLYDPVFCSLTDGPLTLMSTEPQWIHHFELLPEESSGVLEELKHINEITTSNSTITTIGSAIGTIVRLPVAAVQWGLSWFRPSN